MKPGRWFASLFAILLVAAVAAAQPGPRLKILFHVDSPDSARLEMALHNIQSAEMHSGKGNIRMVVVVNGPAVKFLLKKKAGKITEEIDKLAATGEVEFHVCGTSLKAFGYRASDVLSSCRVVPAGVVDIAKLEEEGYAYIKP